MTEPHEIESPKGSAWRRLGTRGVLTASGVVLVVVVFIVARGVSSVREIDERSSSTGRYPTLPQWSDGAAMGRDMEELYRFAADHPEVLRYVPCYCGCEQEGHASNEDCFVRKRDASGKVLLWEKHGLT
jgi:hypothetical protein